VAWACDPRKSVTTSEDGARLSPRKSFEKWVQLVEGKSAPWTAEDIQFARSIGLFVSKRKVEDANRMKSQFLTNMSHEIRTPLGVILGYIDQLDDLFEDYPEVANAGNEMLNSMRGSGTHLLDIINAVLDLSKIESGNIELETTKVDLLELLSEVCSLVRGQAESKGIEFEFEVVGSIPETITTDALRLRQILLNLISNALKFTPKGSIRLSVLFDQSTRRHLILRVTDTGIGVAKENLNKLFKPFSQAESSTTRLYGGTGLGLEISRRFARLLDGDLILESSEVGVGSVFSVRVGTGPVEDTPRISKNNKASASGKPIAPKAVQQEHQFDGLRVLIAEDGLDNRRLLTAVLKKVGCHVETREDGRLAVDEFFAAHESGNPYDLVLMDMQMPVLDGLQATKELRQRGAEIPVIAVTAHAIAGERERCCSAGCTDYVSKPIDRKKLYEAIALAMSNVAQ
jgi:signal transduction histidine kinase/ActR/RegA family two-component response regulator